MQSIVPIAMAVLREELERAPAPAPAPAAGSTRATPSAPASAELLQAADPVEPGDVVYLSHAIQRGRLAGGSQVHATDLLGPSGHRIPATHVRATVHSSSALPSDHLHVEVRVPTGARGCYAGYLQADDLSLRVLLRIIVGRSSS